MKTKTIWGEFQWYMKVIDILGCPDNEDIKKMKLICKIMKENPNLYFNDWYKIYKTESNESTNQRPLS